MLLHVRLNQNKSTPPKTNMEKHTPFEISKEKHLHMLDFWVRFLGREEDQEPLLFVSLILELLSQGGSPTRKNDTAGFQIIY